MHGNHWQSMRRDEIAAAANADTTLLLPIGAIEQHGPHLPINTDSHAVTAVCERASLLPDAPPMLLLPTIWWGLSPYWLPFPGTISLRPETILALIADIGTSVATHGFRRVVIANGHGGNAGIVAVAATQLASAGIRAVSVNWWSVLGSTLATLTPGDGGHIGHAGQTETSVQLALQPERVRMDAINADGCANLVRMRERPFAGVGYAPPLPSLEAPNGVYGDAPAATAELGERVLRLAAERLAAFVAEFAGEATLGV